MVVYVYRTTSAWLRASRATSSAFSRVYSRFDPGGVSTCDRRTRDGRSTGTKPTPPTRRPGSAIAPTNDRRRERHHRPAVVERPADDALVALGLPVEPVVEPLELRARSSRPLVRLASAGPASTPTASGRARRTRTATRAPRSAIVSANGLNHCPATPPMKAIGTNTTTIENVVAATARPISSVPSCAAREVVLPHLDVPHDVLAHHDRVVDQDADRQRQAEQRHRVEREAERPAPR